MRERPILFSAPMVRAILEGRKTQTRRVAKEFNDKHGLDGILARFPNQEGCPYGNPGDRLWVRETWGLFNDLGFCDTSLAGLKQLPHPWQLAYRTDHVDPVNGDGPHRPCWRPSIHMPRWASRITLEITDVRVERLQQISDVDALAEGCSTVDMRSGDSLASVYARLWQSIYGSDSWDVNPWVWVVEFRRVEVEP